MIKAIKSFIKIIINQNSVSVNLCVQCILFLASPTDLFKSNLHQVLRSEPKVPEFWAVIDTILSCDPMCQRSQISSLFGTLGHKQNSNGISRLIWSFLTYLNFLERSMESSLPRYLNWVSFFSQLSSFDCTNMNLHHMYVSYWSMTTNHISIFNILCLLLLDYYKRNIPNWNSSKLTASVSANRQ